LHKLEAFFAFLIATMAISFGYNYFVEIPDQARLFTGLALPWCQDCDKDALLQAVAAVGAIIMPHNLYLHSALVKTRQVDRTTKKAVAEANWYYMIEGSIALFVSFILNLFVIAVFANGLYGTTYSEAYDACNATDSIYTDVFDDTGNGASNEILKADLFKGGIFLGCTFGIACTYIWAVCILASGQSSTMTGTYSGQFAMEGFLNLKWKRWQRVLLTRTIAMGPTFSLAYFSDIENLTGMNDILNALMSIQLPFAIIPTLTFTSSRFVMGEFANGIVSKAMTSALGIIVIIINIFFVSTTFIEAIDETTEWYVYLGLIAGTAIYALFVGYLTVYLLITLGFESLVHFKWVQKCYNVQEYLDEQLQAVEEQPQQQK